VYYKKISLGLTVSATTPAAGAAVSTVPVDYVVNFSDAINTTSVDATDFTVTDDTNAPRAADSFTVNSPTQVTFHYDAAPFSTQGLHTLALPAGSITRASDNGPLTAFSAA